MCADERRSLTAGPARRGGADEARAQVGERGAHVEVGVGARADEGRGERDRVVDACKSSLVIQTTCGIPLQIEGGVATPFFVEGPMGAALVLEGGWKLQYLQAIGDRGGCAYDGGNP